jgi:hypothetical protein
MYKQLTEAAARACGFKIIDWYSNDDSHRLNCMFWKIARTLLRMIRSTTTKLRWKQQRV